MTMAKEIIIIGAGGLARGIYELIKHINASKPEPLYAPLAFVDKYAGETRSLNGLPVIADEAEIRKLVKKNPQICAAIANGDPKVKMRMVEEAKDYGIVCFPTLVHPAAVVCDFVELGQGAIIYAGCVLNCNSSIGAFTHLNMGCTIGHDAIIGDFVNISPGANISGSVKIETGANISTNAAVIQGVVIGENSILGAGACAVRDIPPNVTAVGVPAKPLQKKN